MIEIKLSKKDMAGLRKVYERESLESRVYWLGRISLDAINNGTIDSKLCLKFLKDNPKLTFLEDYKNLLWTHEYNQMISTPLYKEVVSKTTPVILCGGKSSRFGSAKPLVHILGKPMIKNTVDILKSSGFEEKDIYIRAAFDTDSYLKEMTLYFNSEIPDVNVSFTNNSEECITESLHSFSKGRSLEYLYNEKAGWEERIVDIGEPKENILVIPGDNAITGADMQKMLRSSKKKYLADENCVASVLRGVPTTPPKSINKRIYPYRNVRVSQDLGTISNEDGTVRGGFGYSFVRKTTMFMLKRDYMRDINLATNEKIWEKETLEKMFSRTNDPERDALTKDHEKLVKSDKKWGFNYLIKLMAEDRDGYARITDTNLRFGNINTSYDYVKYLNALNEMIKIRNRQPNINIIRERPRRGKGVIHRPAYIWRATPLDYILTERWGPTSVLNDELAEKYGRYTNVGCISEGECSGGCSGLTACQIKMEISNDNNIEEPSVMYMCAGVFEKGEEEILKKR